VDINIEKIQDCVPGKVAFLAVSKQTHEAVVGTWYDGQLVTYLVAADDGAGAGVEDCLRKALTGAG